MKHVKQHNGGQVGDRRVQPSRNIGCERVVGVKPIHGVSIELVCFVHMVRVTQEVGFTSQKSGGDVFVYVAVEGRRMARHEELERLRGGAAGGGPPNHIYHTPLVNQREVEGYGGIDSQQAEPSSEVHLGSAPGRAASPFGKLGGGGVKEEGEYGLQETHLLMGEKREGEKGGEGGGGDDGGGGGEGGYDGDEERAEGGDEGIGEIPPGRMGAIDAGQIVENIELEEVERNKCEAIVEP